MIGRINETEELMDLYNNGNAELAAVYGRRRAGKTYLIDLAFWERLLLGMQAWHHRKLKKKADRR